MYVGRVKCNVPYQVSISAIVIRKSAAEVEWDNISWGIFIADTSAGSKESPNVEFFVVQVTSAELPSTDNVVAGISVVEESPITPVRSQGQNSPMFQSRQAEHRAHGCA